MNFVLRLAFTLPFVAYVFSLHAQESHEKDSMLAVLKTAKHDTDRINTLLSLVEIEYDPEVWPNYNNEALALMEKNLTNAKGHEKDRLLSMKAACLGNIGYGFWESGNLDSTIYYTNASYEIKKQLGDKTGMANSLNNLAYMYQQKGDISNSLETYNECIGLYESEGNQKGMAYAYANIAKIYADQNEFDKALEFQEKGLTAAIASGDKNAESFIHLGMSYVYQQKNRADESMKHLQRALQLSTEIDDKRGQAEAYVNMGTILEDQDSLARAMSLYYNSLRLYREAQMKDGECRALTYIANMQLKMDSAEVAMETALSAMAMAKSLTSPERIRNASDALVRIYKVLAAASLSPEQRAQYFEEALRYHEMFKQMSDSIYNESTQKSTIRQQLRYDFDRKQAEMEAEAERQKLIRYAITGALIVVFLFALVLFNRFRVIRRQKRIIEQQKQTVEHQKALVEEKQHEILDSISYAKRLQDAILPPSPSFTSAFADSFVLYRPKDIVAGDFYWFEKTDTHILLAVADCTGHGVPGALVSVVCSNALNRAVKEFKLRDPGRILDKTRELVIETFIKSEGNVMDGMDISLLSIDLGNQAITWAGANNPVWIAADHEITETKGDKQPVGKYDHAKPFTTHKLDVARGAMIYLFSDGYADQFGGEKGKKFKYSQLKEKLITCCSLRGAEQNTRLNAIFDDWRGNLEQVDDVCVIGIRV